MTQLTSNENIRFKDKYCNIYMWIELVLSRTRDVFYVNHS